VDFRFGHLALLSPAASFAGWSTLIGLGARARVPHVLRAPAYRAFARAVGADLSEVELALGDYDTFGDFFARKLKPGARPVADNESALIAPCDGMIAASGVVTDGTLIQAKGLNYRLADLVVDEAMAARLDGGSYATIYLSPRDYHRVHAPISARIVAYDYVPGELWPVNPRVATTRDGLFTHNERVVIWLESPRAGRIAVVMVAATGVGNMHLAHRDLDTVQFRGAHEQRRIELDERGSQVRRGDELGAFRLGSTVVMVFEPGAAVLDAHAGASVRFGEQLGEVA
jgi:phosphatidylserine decarboxylase